MVEELDDMKDTDANSGEFRKYRILFVGNGTVGSNALSLFRGFEKLNLEVKLFDTAKFDSPHFYSFRRVILRFFPVIYALFCSYFMGIGLRKELLAYDPKLLFVFKGNFVSQKLIRDFKGLKVHYHPDDSTSKVNRTRIFEEAESSYDAHFTSKKHNLNEIEARTGKPVFFIWYAYDEEWHKKDEPLDFENPEFMLGFIGHARSDRLNVVEKLAAIYGKNFAISGLNWRRHTNIRRLAVCLPPSYGLDFSKFIRRSPIQLGFLNSDNRDTHTARTFEIPASGALIILKDTSEHRSVFKSELNALFFSTEEQLLEKIEWALSNPALASIIAEKGHKLITQSPNTWTDRAREIICYIKSIDSSI